MLLLLLLLLYCTIFYNTTLVGLSVILSLPMLFSLARPPANLSAPWQSFLATRVGSAIVQEVDQQFPAGSGDVMQDKLADHYLEGC